MREIERKNLSIFLLCFVGVFVTLFFLFFVFFADEMLGMKENETFSFFRVFLLRF